MPVPGPEGNVYYQHLVDGGISDNLGLEALFEAYVSFRYKAFPSDTSPEKSSMPCFILLIDSFSDAAPSYSAKTHEQLDTRQFVDYIVDRNLLQAFDSFSAQARDNLVRRITKGKPPTSLEYPIYDITYQKYDTSPIVTCKLWHFYFRFIMSHNVLNDNGEQNNLKLLLRNILPMIETHWKLVAPGNCSAEALQSALYDGARVLVYEKTVTALSPPESGLKTKVFKRNGLICKNLNNRNTLFFGSITEILTPGNLPEN